MKARSSGILIGVVGVVIINIAAARGAPVSAKTSDWDGVNASSELYSTGNGHVGSGDSAMWFSPIESAAPVTVYSTDPELTPSHLINENEQTVIPLPAAGWTGLTGLMGLALLRTGKTLRRLFR